MAQGSNGPGVLVACYEIPAVLGRGEEVKEELGISFDAVNAAGEEKAVKVIVETVNVKRVNDGHGVAGDAFLFLDNAGFVGFCESASGGDTAPVA